jgi:hypothetical protein
MKLLAQKAFVGRGALNMLTYGCSAYEWEISRSSILQCRLSFHHLCLFVLAMHG